MRCRFWLQLCCRLSSISVLAVRQQSMSSFSITFFVLNARLQLISADDNYSVSSPPHSCSSIWVWILNKIWQMSKVCKIMWQLFMTMLLKTVNFVCVASSSTYLDDHQLIIITSKWLLFNWLTSKLFHSLLICTFHLLRVNFWCCCCCQHFPFFLLLHQFINLH